jgi:hypothetical protein
LVIFVKLEILILQASYWLQRFIVLFSYPSDFVVEVDAHCYLEIHDPGPQGSMFLETANLKM